MTAAKKPAFYALLVCQLYFEWQKIKRLESQTASVLISLFFVFIILRKDKQIAVTHVC